MTVLFLQEKKRRHCLLTGEYANIFILLIVKVYFTLQKKCMMDIVML